ncbi:HAMP domain-containing histidine kinase [Alphaproteobacteria bacterium KMM 3653]|uniref:histidine kinase n=1 Tax=Harenicola maris TaxID=2841044 RepID=A0AAP2CL42_9RHOB|nr:HAMP domain-containing histidine kinase [Harenicola maris]
MFVNTLSGRFLLLTVIFVMLAEVLIFVPSVARFREDYLQTRLEKAQIASLALLAVEDMIDQELEAELLENAGVLNVVLRRDEIKQLILSSTIPAPIYATYDLRRSTVFGLVRDAQMQVFDSEERIIRVIGEPVQGAGMLIEVTMSNAKLRAAMIDYGLRILLISAIISVVTAFMLFLAVRRLLVTPIKRVVRHMKSYSSAPEDARRIIVPTAGVTELFEAESALQDLQTQLTSSLRQKEHLAQLGGAVAKISHDLRNILTTAQLFADRMEMSNDPGVQRAAPKLVSSISRAVSLCESTLAFGKAEESPPKLSRLPLGTIIQDVIDSEALSAEAEGVRIQNECDPEMSLRADPEQLYRVLSNLVRNARQALSTHDGERMITLTAQEDRDGWTLRVSDSGPGLPPKAQENLFQAFQGGARKGGSGLGLVIAQELIRGHGGTLKLDKTGPDGTDFVIYLPKAILSLDAVAK